jgi:sulfite reductase (NADPH) hemoprotein beta-component
VTAETILHAVTANRLRDGTIIYYTAKQDWSESFADAAAAADGDALLAEAVAGPLAREAVGAYVIEVTQSEGGMRPIGLREEIRAFGPTA